MPAPFTLRVPLFVLWLLSPFLWLPLVRATLQPTYQWGMFGLGGRGLSGDYAVLFALTATTWALVYYAWRRPASLTVRLALAGWLGAVTTLVAVPALRGDGLIFHGDTLGVHVNLSWVAVASLALVLGFAIAAVMPSFRARARTVPTRTPQPLRRWPLRAALLLACLQIPCLVFGKLHGAANQIGVIATMVQAMAIVAALRVPRPKGFLSASWKDAG